jgi:hypothetical protein
MGGRGPVVANSASTLPKMIATTSAWANSASVARNAGNAIVVRRIRSAFGVAAPSTPSDGRGTIRRSL